MFSRRYGVWCQSSILYDLLCWCVIFFPDLCTVNTMTGPRTEGSVRWSSLLVISELLSWSVTELASFRSAVVVVFLPS